MSVHLNTRSVENLFDQIQMTTGSASGIGNMNQTTTLVKSSTLKQVKASSINIKPITNKTQKKKKEKKKVQFPEVQGMKRLGSTLLCLIEDRVSISSPTKISNVSNNLNNKTKRKELHIDILESPESREGKYSQLTLPSIANESSKSLKKHRSLRELIARIEINAKKQEPPPSFVPKKEDLLVNAILSPNVFSPKQSPNITAMGCQSPVVLPHLLYLADQRARKRQVIAIQQQQKMQDYQRDTINTINSRMEKASNQTLKLQKSIRQRVWLSIIHKLLFVYSAHQIVLSTIQSKRRHFAACVIIRYMKKWFDRFVSLSCIEFHLIR